MPGFLRPITRFAGVAAVLALAACGGPTAYAPAMNGDGGYTERQIEDNRYRVQFRGNSLTDRETVETYLLYRAAEVTLASGHDYFRIVGQDVEPTTTYYGDAPGVGVFGSHGYGYGSGIGLSLGTTLSPATSYEAVVNILVFKGPKPQDDPDAYDAREVIRLIGPAVRRPQPE